MKKLLSILLMLASAASAAVRDGSDELDRTSAEVAARVVLESLASNILAAPPAQPVLHDAMASKPADYTDPDSARASLRPLFRQTLDSRYAAEAAAILARLARPRPAAQAFSAAFLAEASALPAARAEAAVSNLYPAAFSAARAKACAEQAGRLVASVRPTEAEVDALPPDRLRAELTGKLAAAQKAPVFKENLSYISDKLADPLIADARKQRTYQANSLRHSRPEGWAPAVIESNLVSALRARLDARRANAAPDAPVYGFFPSITNKIARECAVRVACGRFTEQVGEVEIKIDADSVLKEIEREPARHLRREDSRQAFAPLYRTQVFDAALAAAKAAAPAAERADFEACVKKESATINRAVAARVDKDLLPALDAVRQSCAERQFTGRFPELASGEWFPGSELADRVFKKPDFRAAVAAWRDLPELRSFAETARKHPLMEETVARLDTRIAAAFDLARTAHTAQQGIAEELYPAILANYRAALASGGTAPDLDAIVRAYTAEAQKSWSASRKKVLWKDSSALPRNADRQHADLFPSTRKHIELLAKSILEALKEKSKEAKPAPQAPVTLTPREMPCTFSIGRAGDSFQIRIEIDGRGCGTVACPADPARYAAAAPKSVTDALAPLRAAIQEATRKNLVTLKAGIIVRDGLVYYGLVRQLAEAIPRCADDYGESVTGCTVTDSLKP